MTLRLQRSLLIPLLLIILYGCNESQDNQLDDVVLNGDHAITHEVNTVFTDPGITLQDGYQVITTDPVDETICGEYTIEYRVIDDQAILQKTLLRAVTVVDTTPPTLDLDDDFLFSFGFHTVDDVIESLEDNYSDNSNLTVTSTLQSANPNYLSGTYPVSVTITDEAGNSTTEDIQLTYAAVNLYLVFNHHYENHDDVSDISIRDYGDRYASIIAFKNGITLTASTNNHVIIDYPIETAYDSAWITIQSTFRRFDKAFVTLNINHGDTYVSIAVDDYNVLASPMATINTFDYYDNNNLAIDDATLASLMNTHVPSALNALDAIFTDVEIPLK